jgi:hypothetical protein
MDTKFSELAIVGWYHTHPDFGIFLSDRDRFIQEHFFSGPGQFAHVIDPIRKIEGVFAWRAGKPALCEYYWIGDRILTGEARETDGGTAQSVELRAGSSRSGGPSAVAAANSGAPDGLSPNSAPHAICIGDHWSPGEPLWSIMARIGEMIAYQTYNTRSPLNGEAARWVDEHLAELPLDPVSMMPDDAGAAAPLAPSGARLYPPVPAAARPLPGAPPAPPSRPEPRPVGAATPARDAAAPPEAEDAPAVACPTCGATLRLRPELAGKQVRCLRCRTVFRIPSP